MPETSNTEMVENFFRQIEKDTGKELFDNCIFSVSFENSSLKANIKSVVSGKELLAKCFLFSVGIQNSLNDKIHITIDILSNGWNPDNENLSYFFEVGVKTITKPSIASIIDYVKILKPFL